MNVRSTLGNILSAADRFFESQAIYRRRSGGADITISVVRDDESAAVYDGETPQSVRRTVFGCDTAALNVEGQFVAPVVGDLIFADGGRWKVVSAGGICWRHKFGALSNTRIEIFAELQQWQ